MTFTKRPLVAGATLGDRLRSLREEARLSVEDIGKRIAIAPKYLTAIETSRYKELPGLVYARQFVRRYAEALETDVTMAMGIFEQEYAVVMNTGKAARPLLTPRVNTDFPWYRRHGRFILAGVIIALVLTYLGIQAVRNFLPPKLVVSTPNRDISTRELQQLIAGQTDPGASVTINDQDVQTSDTGEFSVVIDLHNGLNTLKISATKKHSSARVVSRQVLVE